MSNLGLRVVDVEVKYQNRGSIKQEGRVTRDVTLARKRLVDGCNICEV